MLSGVWKGVLICVGGTEVHGCSLFGSVSKRCSNIGKQGGRNRPVEIAGPESNDEEDLNFAELDRWSSKDVIWPILAQTSPIMRFGSCCYQSYPYVPLR